MRGGGASSRRPAVRAGRLPAVCAVLAAALSSCSSLSPIRLESAVPGPTLLVVAGVHGDEPSGPAAARALVARGPSRRGRILVVPEASPGAVASESRSAPGEADLNRSFPGVSGDPAGRRARALFRLVRSSEPDLVLDLHESDGTWTEGAGPFLVVPPLTRAAELALAMLERPGMEGFSFTGGPPAGSLAAEAARLLETPVLIVEIPDGLPASRRAGLFRAVLDAAMGVLGMADAEGAAPRSP